MAFATRKDEYIHKILALMPPSDGAFPVETGTHPEWDKWIAALASGPAAVHDRALEALAEAFPAEVNETLERYEAMLALPDEFSPASPSVAERLAAVIARLTYFGQSDQTNLQATLRDLFDDSTVELFGDRVYPALMSNVNEVGRTRCGKAGVYVSTCEYIDHTLEADPNVFADWFSVGSVTANSVYDPVTVTQIGDTVTGILSSGVREIRGQINGTINDDDVRCSIWLKSPAGARDVTLALHGKAGAALVESKTIVASPDRWQKITITNNVGSGGSSPTMRVNWADADGATMYMASAFAGIRDLLLEAKARTYFQLHIQSSVEFLIKGESGL